MRRHLNEYNEVVLGLIISDIHLRHTPPKARTAEKSWYAAMKRALDEIHSICFKLGCNTVFYPGDIFHTYDQPPELINFALENLPRGYSIPGQHDLPLHNYGDLHKSAYYTLVKAGVLLDLPPGEPCCFKKLDRTGKRHFVVGFPWQSVLKKNEDPDNFYFAMAHRYVWVGSHSFRGAAEDDKITQLVDFLSTYTAVAFGDNHKGFMWNNAINCGSLMRHNVDQMDYEPQIGVLLSSGKIIPLALTYIKHDKWTSVLDVSTTGEIADLKELSKRFKKLASEIVDFSDLLEVSIKQSNLTGTQQEILLSEIYKIRLKGGA